MLVGKDEYAWAWIQMQRRFIMTVICFSILTKRFPKIPHYCTCRTLRDRDFVSFCQRTYILQRRARVEWGRISFELPTVRPSKTTSHSPGCVDDNMPRALFSTPALNCNNIVVHFATRFTDSFSRQFRGPAKLNMVRVVPKEPKAALKGAKI